MTKKLKDVLINANLITPEQYIQAVEEQEKSNESLCLALVRLGFVDEQELTEILSKHYDMPFIDLEEIEIDSEIFRLVPENWLRENNMIPLQKAGRTLVVATDDPSNISAKQELEFLTGLKVELTVGGLAIRRAIEENSGNLIQAAQRFDTAHPVEFLTEEGKRINVDLLMKDMLIDPAILKFINIIFNDALEKGATEIHIENSKNSLRVRLRIDGFLYEAFRPTHHYSNPLLIAIKSLAELNIQEDRLPQDGFMKIKFATGPAKDVQVSIGPALSGERVTLKFFEREDFGFEMERLGFEEHQLDLFRRSINKFKGMILFDRFTAAEQLTVYCALNELNSPSLNIMTAEQPVRYYLDGLNQFRIRHEFGFNYAVAIRSSLRQAADIIYIAEILDWETAHSAAEAALTGRLLFSSLRVGTVHTAVRRLIDLDLEAFVVAESVNLILSQRQLRKLCPECKTATETNTDVLTDLGMDEETAESCELYKSNGCPSCFHTGYKGQTGVFELFEMNDDVKELVLRGVSVSELKQESRRQGMATLREAAMNKATQGITSLEEVMRVTSPE